MPDYSIVDTTCLICGFADKGQDYAIKWINTLQTLVDNYGYPQTEEERYFWNACAEVLNKGGICLAAKLPYSNLAHQTLPFVEYKISQLKDISASSSLSSLTAVDPSLTSYIQIEQRTNTQFAGYADLSTYDYYLTDSGKVESDTLKIFALTNEQYGLAKVGQPQINGGLATTAWTDVECLGIMPVVVTPANAMFYQQVLSSETRTVELSDEAIEYRSPYIDKYSILSVEKEFDGQLRPVFNYNADCIMELTTTHESVLTAVIAQGDSETEEVMLPLSDFLSGNLRAISNQSGEYFPISADGWNVVISEEGQEMSAFINLSGQVTLTATGVSVEKTNGIESFTVIKDIDTVVDLSSNSKQNKYQSTGLRIDSFNYSTPLSSSTLNDYTVSKEASMQMPQIGFDDFAKLDNDALKQIGIVVYKVVKDPAASTKISFQLQEAFVGSLDRNAKGSSGQSIFIDTVVNTQSRLIRLFSNISRVKAVYQKSNGEFTPYAVTRHDMASMYSIQPQVGIVLGQYQDRCSKHINVQESIIKPLNLIFETASNKNKYVIDLLVDAGVSNIAQAYFSETIGSSFATLYDSYSDKLKSMTLASSNDTNYWKTVLQKYDNFCKNIRQDCMFIADGLRPFCIDGDSKIVRDTAPENSLDKDVIPKLKWMSGMNTSYGAGYCDWFRAPDQSTGDLMWLPPSIKAMGAYLYTDAYFNPWDAPAGMTRGRLQNIVDCAFSPNQQESGKLYLQCWNYACNYPIDGIILEGQKTFQRKKTAFDRVNVRRLFLNLEREVARIARYHLYEGNTAWQRQRFVDAIRPLFENAKQRNGIIEYYIKCDDDNNTPFVIDNNEMRCSIAVKPVKTIEFILLNFVCTNQSATVSEEIVQ